MKRQHRSIIDINLSQGSRGFPRSRNQVSDSAFHPPSALWPLPSALAILSILLITLICFVPAAAAFCGFYVSKADAKLYNKASQVVIARDGTRTILTMANDYQGDLKDFALVVPVPVVLQEDQVRVGDPKIIERLDAFSAPRLVEYFDSDPCAIYPAEADFGFSDNAAPAAQSRIAGERRENTLGVTVESRFTVGEYDILILSARESNGLETWLRRNGYRIPRGAHQLLRPYIRQKMKFFVAKVNLGEFEKAGTQFLRPLMMAYESPKFMLPIRLGMVNGSGEQDLIVYVLTPKGQTEITNYRTVKIPSDNEIPIFVKNEFGDFYKAMFERSHAQEGKNVAFLEYAWNMAWCDPCAANPLTPEELRKAGVFWLNEDRGPGIPNGRFAPIPPNPNVFISRLHVRYSRNKFPADLQFQTTANQQNFQGRYVLRHPFQGATNCPAGRQYQRQLRQRQEQEVQTLAKLTGWNVGDIRRKARIGQRPAQEAWWRNVWPDLRKSRQDKRVEKQTAKEAWWRSVW